MLLSGQGRNASGQLRACSRVSCVSLYIVSLSVTQILVNSISVLKVVLGIV